MRGLPCTPPLKIQCRKFGGVTMFYHFVGSISAGANIVTKEIMISKNGL
jgi:hypothetical protein